MKTEGANWSHREVRGGDDIEAGKGKKEEMVALLSSHGEGKRLPLRRTFLYYIDGIGS